MDFLHHPFLLQGVLGLHPSNQASQKDANKLSMDTPSSQAAIVTHEGLVQDSRSENCNVILVVTSQHPGQGVVQPNKASRKTKTPRKTKVHPVASNVLEGFEPGKMFC